TTIPVREALRWITTEGARMLGRGDQIGSLTPGKLADLVIINASELNLLPVHDPVAHRADADESRQYRARHDRRRREKAERARAQGIGIAASPAEAVVGCAVIVTSLPDDTALRAVMLGPTGLIGAMTPGAVLIETSTVSAEASADVGAAAQTRGIAYLRAPVSGNASIVHTGALTCFVSGPKDAFENAKPLFAAFTRAQTYLGAGEEARYAKLSVNLMIAVSAAMMAESLTLARKGGIAWQDILKVLDDSAVASPMVKYKTAPLRTRDF